MKPTTELNTNPIVESNPVIPEPVPAVISRPVIPDINLATSKPVDISKQRHFLAAFFFSYIFGVFGVDRFYLGKIWTGILKFMTFGGLGVWALIDLNVIISGGMRDKQGNKLLEAERYRKFASRTVLISTLVILIILALISAFVIYFTTLFISNGGLDGIVQSLTGGGSNMTNINLDQLKNLNVGL